MLENSSIEILLARLSWPVRLTRWLAAKNIASLLEHEEIGDQVRAQYLVWLSEQRLESEILSGMAVLLCVENYKALPDFRIMQMSIKKHSILSAALMNLLYKENISSEFWRNNHSGQPISDFEIDSYFDKNKCAHIATIFSLKFEELENIYGLPFTNQWAFEWTTLMKLNKCNHSGYPNHFVSNYDGSRGLRGQFEQVQSDVFRSAYLRTLSFAVSHWGMPEQMALEIGALTLPLNKGLTKISLANSPSWLSDIPSICSLDADIELIARKIIKQFNDSNKSDTLVELRAPLNSKRSEFGKLHITAILTSADYVPSESYETLGQTREWSLPSDISMEGHLASVNMDEYGIPGEQGVAYPVCLHLFPKPFGYWQSDIISNGVSLPAPYCFTKESSLNWVNGIAILEIDGVQCANYQAWLENWAPVYFKDGGPRTGFATSMKTSSLHEFVSENNLKLAWYVVLEDVLNFESHSEESKLSRKHIYFSESQLRT